MKAQGDSSARQGFALVTGATIIAGIGGYLITVIAGKALGSDYREFAAFWAALYLVVGALVGVQHEVTRATSPGGPAPRGDRRTSIVRFAALAASATTLAVLALGAALGPTLFPRDTAGFILPLALGAGTYILVSATAGTIYGVQAWRLLAVYIVFEVALRLVFVGFGALADWSVPALAWAVVAPFAILIGVIAIPLRRKLFLQSHLDVGYRQLARNMARTIVAAGSTAVLVSGFPLFLDLSSRGVDSKTLSAVIFSLILTRAPLVVLSLSLQSFLLVQFQNAPDRLPRLVIGLLVGIALLGVVLAGIAFVIGADLIALIGDAFRVPQDFVALLVLSSIPTAWIAITGTALLSRGAHTAYSAGWAIAAVSGVALVFIPGDIFVRVIVALGVAPLLGLVVHVVALVRGYRGRELLDS